MLQGGRTRLRAYCTRMRLKQYELADLLGMHEATLSQIFSGVRRPGLDTALRIQRITGIPVDAWSDTERGTTESDGRRQRKTRNLDRVQNRDGRS